MTPWTCRCGAQGDPTSEADPFTDWRVHSNTEHGTRITGEQLRDARDPGLVTA